jgi:hypothetical protein
MTAPGNVQLDIASTIARIEQLAAEPADSPLRELLIMRLATCDAPRLRRLLTPEMLGQLAEAAR